MTISLLVTVLAMCYVYQRVEIIKSGYSLQKSRRYLTHLVDRNSALMYNLSRLESPRSLLASMSEREEEIRFARNRTPEVPVFDMARIEPERMPPQEGVVGNFFDLFTPRAEAWSRN
jgi:hypothetical protein